MSAEKNVGGHRTGHSGVDTIRPRHCLIQRVHARATNQAAGMETAELLGLQEYREGVGGITYTFLSVPFDFGGAVY